MIFLCFSSKDRHCIVEAILFHLMSFEIPVWYDRQKMLLGDDRNIKNFDEGVKKAEYTIIVLSPNAISSVCANEEIDLIFDCYKSGSTLVFPLFYNISASDIPDKFAWMKKLVYKEINNHVDVYSACNHIVCKFLLDELKKYKFQTIDSFISLNKSIPSMVYIVEMFSAYRSINGDNYDAKISILFSIYLYIKTHYNMECVPLYYSAGMDHLFNETKLHLSIDLRETIIVEHLTLLLLNSVLFGYIT